MQKREDTIIQFLTFLLDNETYAADISHIREVLDIPKITSVPTMPSFIRGVINLRGKVVPVVDLRKKFNLVHAEDSIRSCIIIIEIPLDGEVLLIGAIADSVKEVMRLENAKIEEPPRLGNRLKSDFIEGMINHEGEFIIVLNLEKVFSLEELEEIGTELSQKTED